MMELVYVTVLKKDYLIQFGQILKMLSTLMMKMEDKAKKKMKQPKKNKKEVKKKTRAKSMMIQPKKTKVRVMIYVLHRR